VIIYEVSAYSNDEGFISEYVPTVKDARARIADMKRRFKAGEDIAPRAIYKVTLVRGHKARELACRLLNQRAFYRERELVEEYPRTTQAV
jgi:hypothetical protein